MPRKQGEPWKWSDVWDSVTNVQRTTGDTATGSVGDRGPRVPTEEERQEWIDSMPEGVRPEDVRLALHDIDARKWRQLQLGMKWMKHELRKMGLNPDEARWYL